MKNLFEICTFLNAQQFGGHHIVQLSETVVATSVGFGEDSEWALIVVGHDDDTMCSFVNQAEGFTHCVCRGKSDGRLINWVTGLHEVDNRLNDVERYILRKNH